MSVQPLIPAEMACKVILRYPSVLPQEPFDSGTHAVQSGKQPLLFRNGGTYPFPLLRLRFIEHALISVQSVMDDRRSFLYPVLPDFLQPFRRRVSVSYIGEEQVLLRIDADGDGGLLTGCSPELPVSLPHSGESLIRLVDFDVISSKNRLFCLAFDRFQENPAVSEGCVPVDSHLFGKGTDGQLAVHGIAGPSDLFLVYPSTVIDGSDGIGEHLSAIVAAVSVLLVYPYGCSFLQPQ